MIHFDDKLQLSKALRASPKSLVDLLKHDDIAHECEETACSLVICVTHPLTKALESDPRHVHIENLVLCGEVEATARERLMHHDFRLKELATQFSQDRFNWKDDDTPISLQSELHDAIVQAQICQMYPQIVDEFREECKYEYDEDRDEEVRISDEAFAQKWEQRSLEIFLPRMSERRERMFPNAPKPFCWSSAALEQWFFVDRGDAIEYDRGNARGSGGRFTNGLMGHAFAVLASRGSEIPTYYVEHTPTNDLHLVKKWDTLRLVDNIELTENYKPPASTDPALFDGLLLRFDYESMRIAE